MITTGDILMVGYVRPFHPEHWPEPPLNAVYRLDGCGRFVTVVYVAALP